jgi:hypothetical protein
MKATSVRRFIVRTIFLATLLLGLAGVASAQQWGFCSPSMVAGAWGYSITGTLILPSGAVAFAVVGQYTLDTDGNMSGARTVSANGVITTSTIKGTATVNSDCTGTMRESFYDQSGNLVGSSVKTVVYVDGAREARGILTAVLLPNGTSVPAVLTSNARKLFPVGFHGEPY